MTIETPAGAHAIPKQRQLNNGQSTIRLLTDAKEHKQMKNNPICDYEDCDQTASWVFYTVKVGHAPMEAFCTYHVAVSAMYELSDDDIPNVLREAGHHD